MSWSIGWFAPLLGHDPSRVPDVFERLAPLLAARGHATVTASPVRSSVGRTLDLSRTMHRSRHDLDVAVVHVYSGRYFRVVDLLTRQARRARLPVVGVLAGGALPALAARRPAWVREVLSRPASLVAPSPYLARFAVEAGAEATVIPNPLEIDGLAHRVRRPAAPRLLWLRALHDIYDPVAAVEVVADLAARGIEASLTMAGADKGAEPEVRRAIADLGVGDRVRLVGFVTGEAKARLFDEHDVFLNTTTVDNTPVSVVEAAAAGLVVVSTDVGGLPDLLDDDVDALLVPARDPAAMADAVAAVLDDPGLAARLSADVRAVAERCDPVAVADAWEVLLARVCGPGTA